MISHRYRCIFVHVPRTGGTSIEKVLCGKDWWWIESKTKHLKVSEARSLYAKWWGSYLTFTVYRPLQDRVASFHRAFGEWHGEPWEDVIDGELDEVLRFSDLKKDWARLAAQLGAPKTLPHVGKTC